ncbi:hypothetical protein FA95DRAFT_128264 [Auriscalpium vulgare]|uniref:Uncharacterized protein n=1 Tax=Auriscalpium vulgare TaxID=40419 RepID=A0ACB8RMX4_9AGAM|nr:hypothetical protein FA95DRAFT_128264 [Auriscalpium vulgare]
MEWWTNAKESRRKMENEVRVRSTRGSHRRCCQSISPALTPTGFRDGLKMNCPGLHEVDVGGAPAKKATTTKLPRQLTVPVFRPPAFFANIQRSTVTLQVHRDMRANEEENGWTCTYAGGVLCLTRRGGRDDSNAALGRRPLQSFCFSPRSLPSSATMPNHPLPDVRPLTRALDHAEVTRQVCTRSVQGGTRMLRPHHSARIPLCGERSA